ncbi:MAG TPA: hypothetical protein VF322_10220 [Gammaproteobacteria bacterium]
MSARRRRVVLCNPCAVLYTMPLALLAVGSALDPDEHEVVVVLQRLRPAPRLS